MTPYVSNATVVGLGVGMVFFGLICLIAICYLLGFVMKSIGKKSLESVQAVKSDIPPSAERSPVSVENRQELIAAVSAAIAEELGTDVEAIRIKSIKKL